MKTLIRWSRGLFDGELRFLLRNSSWTLIGQITNVGVAFAKAILLARALGPTGFGIFSLVVAFIGTIQQFFDLNLGQPFIKFGNDYAAGNSSGKFKALVRTGWLSAAWSAGAFLMVGGFILGGWLSFSTDHQDLRPMWPVLLCLCLSAAVDLTCGFANGLLKYKFLFREASFIEIGGALLELLAILTALAVWGANVGALVGAMAVASVLKSGLTMRILLKYARDLALAGCGAKVADLRSDARALTSFTVSNSLSRSLKTAYSTGDVIILAAVVSAADVGCFSAAKKLGFAIVLITQPLLSTIYAQLSQLIANHRYAAASNLVKKITFIGFGITLPFVLLIMWFREEVAVLAFGSVFRNAGSVLVWMLLIGIVRAVFFWTNSLLLALGRAKERLLYDVLALVLAATLGWVGAKHGGAAGFACGLLVAQALREGIVIVRTRLLLQQKLRDHGLPKLVVTDLVGEPVN